MPTILSLDLETYSSAPLPKCGVYRYTDAPDFEILLFSYAYDDEPVVTIDLACGEEIPTEVISALEDGSIIKYGWNSSFERVCLSKHLGHWLDPHQWRCSMVEASYQTLPLHLGDAAVALNVSEKKMEEGKDLIRYFSVPCKPTKTNGGRTRNLPEHAPEKWALYKKYNAQDVETERAIRKELMKHPLPENEWELYALDQIINDRGVRIDKSLVKKAIAVDEVFTERAYARARELTGLENPGSVNQLKAWLADNDVPMESLAKKLVQEKAAVTDGLVGELLKLRLELSKTSIKKYESMARCVCSDGRIHGMLQFGGASRTMRWSGRLVQLQNVPANHLADLDLAREIVKEGDVEQIEMLYGSVPNTLSELIRTALIPKDGHRFIVCDFSAIEARVLAWLANEEWVLEEFRGEGKIYEATASRMYHIPQETIVKGHPNYEYRQKGKQATLSCIAEGQMVLTDQGLVAIENVKLHHKLWDGEDWVSHEGVVYQGEKEVISYDGLTATEDHLVWIEGQARPVHFGFAAVSGARLVCTEYCGQAIRLGENHQPRKTMEREMAPLLCPDGMRIVPQHTVDPFIEPDAGTIQGMSKLLTGTETHTDVAGASSGCGEIPVRKPQRSAISLVRRARDKVLLSFGDKIRNMDSGESAGCKTGIRIGSHRQQRALCAGKYSIRAKREEPWQPKTDSVVGVGSAVLALLQERSNENAVGGQEPRGNNRIGTRGSSDETKKLETDRRKVRLYDIRNAGPHHRFTVSGRLVHNCGYGGGVGALKAMGAKMPEAEMQPLVDAWRAANPSIVKLWSALDRAVRHVTRNHEAVRVGKVRLYYEDERMFIRLPSGRNLCYISPRIVSNRFGNESFGFLSPMKNGQLAVTESWGASIAENITQSIARDLLGHGMLNLEAAGYRIVFDVHDEAVMEMPNGVGTVEEASKLMCENPNWAMDLPLKAAGYECLSYRKD